MQKIFSRFLYLLLFVSLFASFPAPAEAALPVIKADRQYFDFEKGLHVLSGNVVIEHNSRRVTAGEAKTNMIEVWASGNITFQQDDIQMSGSSLYATFAKNFVQIQNVDFSRSSLRITSDSVDFNWKTKLAVFTGNVRIDADGTSSTADTATYNVQSNSFL